MEQKTPASPNRLIFFDNLRYLMILLVLIFHSGASYGSIVAFWPYQDPNPTEVVDLLLMILDVFMMSILFFIAGYFALPSLQKKGSGSFVKDKFKRLGIPWLIVTILVLPILDYARFSANLAKGDETTKHKDTFLLTPIKRSLPALVAITVLAACSCSGATALENTAWELESLNGNAVLPGTTITLEFSSDQVSGSAGCNHYGGSYKASQNKLSAGDLFATEMWCQEPEGVMEEEQAYLAALSAAAKYQISDSELEILDETGTQVLVFVAPGSKALEEEDVPTRTTPKFSLDCTLEMDETYPVGEPVNLRFELHNPTDRPLYVLIWYTPLEGITGDIFQVTRDGEELPYQGMLAKRGDPTLEEYIAIEPGEATSAEVDLRMGYDLSAPGSYQVQFTTGLQDVTDDVSLIPRKRDDHRPQSLSCDPVSFRIVPAPESPTATFTPEPPAGFKQYQDSVTGVSIYMPESWVVIEVIPGESAILQSYPEDKYVGGEPFEPGDTKCDLTIRPSDIDVVSHMQQLKSDPTITVISEQEIVLQSGKPGIRLEVDSMGRSLSLIAEVNERVVVLTCFGELEPFDEIAVTIGASE
jgi:peptidyl-Lys metalloendopeptidase